MTTPAEALGEKVVEAIEAVPNLPDHGFGASRDSSAECSFSPGSPYYQDEDHRVGRCTVVSHWSAGQKPNFPAMAAAAQRVVVEACRQEAVGRVWEATEMRDIKKARWQSKIAAEIAVNIAALTPAPAKEEQG